MLKGGLKMIEWISSKTWGVSDGLPGLVNLQKAMERSTMLLMGKSTINALYMVIFNSKLLVYQRVEMMLKQPRNWICDDV